MEDLLHLNMELDDYALDGVLAGIGVGFWILRYQNAIETEENGVRIPRLGLPFVQLLMALLSIRTYFKIERKGY